MPGSELPRLPKSTKVTLIQTLIEPIIIDSLSINRHSNHSNIDIALLLTTFDIELSVNHRALDT